MDQEGPQIRVLSEAHTIGPTSSGYQGRASHYHKYGVAALIFGVAGPIEHVPHFETLAELPRKMLLNWSADSRGRRYQFVADNLDPSGNLGQFLGPCL